MFSIFVNPRQRLEFTANQVQSRLQSSQMSPIRQFKQMCQLIVVVSVCLFLPIPLPNRHQFVQQHSMCLEPNAIHLQCQTRRPETCPKSCLRCYTMPHVNSNLSPFIFINPKSTQKASQSPLNVPFRLRFVPCRTQMPQRVSNRLIMSPTCPYLPTTSR